MQTKSDGPGQSVDHFLK